MPQQEGSIDGSTEIRSKPLGVLSLVCIGFFWVSGGIYGNEELIAAAPPLLMNVSVLLGALCFALPLSLMTAELGAAIPADGGQVAWVQMVFGRIIGGHNGYWIWFTNVLDAAVYPQLAAQYVALAFNLGAQAKAMVPFAFIIPVAIMNVTGLACVTKLQGVIFVVSLTPCLIYIAAGLPHLDLGVALSMPEDAATDYAQLFSWTLWLFSGFASLGSLAGEINRPNVTYPAAIALLLPLTTLLTLTPGNISLSLDNVIDHYEAGYFGQLAGKVAGSWLTVLFSVGSNVSMLGLYTSQMITAEQTMLGIVQGHGFFADAHETENAPGVCDAGRDTQDVASDAGSDAKMGIHGKRASWVMRAPSAGGAPRCIVLVNAGISCVLTFMDYSSLIMVEMMLVCISTTLFFLSFIALRVQQPKLDRSVKVPGGTIAAVLYSLPSLIICVITFVINFMVLFNSVAFVCVIAGGLVVHMVGYFVLSSGDRRHSQESDSLPAV